MVPTLEGGQGLLTDRWSSDRSCSDKGVHEERLLRLENSEDGMIYENVALLVTGPRICSLNLLDNMLAKHINRFIYQLRA